jgi:hypothetical protein
MRHNDDPVTDKVRKTMTAMAGFDEIVTYFGFFGNADQVI